jgi:hypothetical protein
MPTFIPNDDLGSLSPGVYVTPYEEEPAPQELDRFLELLMQEVF